MAKTLNQIEKQIAQLKKEAEALKQKEVGGVVARIKEAIEHYQLTPQDIFGGRGKAPANGKKPGPKKAGRSKGASAPKFRSEDGKTWTGHGKRPNWFKAALEAGKTPEDLMIR